MIRAAEAPCSGCARTGSFANGQSRISRGSLEARQGRRQEQPVEQDGHERESNSDRQPVESAQCRQELATEVVGRRDQPDRWEHQDREDPDVRFWTATHTVGTRRVTSEPRTQ